VVVPEPCSAEDFAALALNVLLERVAATTGELERLRAQLRGGRAPQRELADACAALEEHGWLFGLFARELGSDVLFERRERRGLQLALELVREMLARERIELRLPPLPELDSGDRRCNTLCAVVARCVHAAGGALEWDFARAGGETALSFSASAGPRLQRALEDGASRIEGARVRGDGRELRLVLPRDCWVWP